MRFPYTERNPEPKTSFWSIPCRVGKREGTSKRGYGGITVDTNQVKKSIKNKKEQLLSLGLRINQYFSSVAVTGYIAKNSFTGMWGMNTYLESDLFIHTTSAQCCQ